MQIKEVSDTELITIFEKLLEGVKGMQIKEVSDTGLITIFEIVTDYALGSLILDDGPTACKFTLLLYYKVSLRIRPITIEGSGKSKDHAKRQALKIITGLLPEGGIGVE